VQLFAALAFIALMRWAARPGRGTAALAGAATAVAALYTYQPLKLFPLLIVLWLLWLRHADRRRFDDLLAGAIPFAAAFLIVGAPMLAVAVTNPVSFFGRATVVSAFNPGSAADSDLSTHILRTFAMFGFLGDQNGRHDVAALPLLQLPLVAVAALGVARMWRQRRDAAHSLVLISLPVFLLPPLIATEGYSPHFLRALGLAVPLALTIGFGAAELVELARGRWGPWAGRASISIVAVGLAAIAVWSGAVYFSRSVADRYEPYSYQVTAMGQYAADHPGSAVIIDGFSATDIQFVYYYDLPAIFEPGTRIPNPGAYTTILAGTRDALSRALGSDASARAQPVNWDPSGKPDVWAVSP
jgi:4-amino-4-deoxy-L-arabinose transferase-like glycosyltransferase